MNKCLAPKKGDKKITTDKIRPHQSFRYSDTGKGRHLCFLPRAPRPLATPLSLFAVYTNDGFILAE